MKKLLAACLSLFASSAFAAADSVEIQFNSTNISNLVADRARASVWSCYASFPFQGHDTIIDHIEFPGAPSFRMSLDERVQPLGPTMPVSAKQLQLKLPVTAFLKRVSTLQSSASAQEAYVEQTPRSIIFDLSIRGVADANEAKQDNNDRDSHALCFRAASIEPAFAGDTLVLDRIREKMGDACFELESDNFSGLLGKGATITAAGISGNPSMSKIAVRFQYDKAASSHIPWKSFFNDGAITSMSTPGGFGVSVHTGLISKALKKNFSDKRIHLYSPGIVTNWPQNMPLMNMSFEGYVSELPCDIDVDGSASLLFTLAPTKDKIIVSGDMTHDTSTWDIATCPGAWVGTASGLIFGGFIGVVAGLGTTVVGQVYADNQGPSQSDMPEHCTLVDSDSVRCEYKVGLPEIVAGGLSMKMALDSFTRSGDEMVLAGTLTQTGYQSYAPRVTLPDVTFNFGVHGSCGGGLSVGIEGRFKALSGGMSVPVCNKPMSLQSDPNHMFSMLYLEQIYETAWDKEVLFGGEENDMNAYWANPYAASVYVRTPGGSRTVPFGPVEQPTQAELDGATFELVNARVRCMKLETGWHGIPGMFDPQWKVDPPYEKVATVRSYDPLLRSNPASPVRTCASRRRRWWTSASTGRRRRP